MYGKRMILQNKNGNKSTAAVDWLTQKHTLAARRHLFTLSDSERGESRKDARANRISWKVTFSEWR